MRPLTVVLCVLTTLTGTLQQLPDRRLCGECHLFNIPGDDKSHVTSYTPTGRYSLDQFTLSFWLKVDPEDIGVSYMNITRYAETFSIRIHREQRLMADDDDITMWVNLNMVSETFVVKTASFLDWIHMVVMWDGQESVVRVYLNGFLHYESAGHDDTNTAAAQNSLAVTGMEPFMFGGSGIPMFAGDIRLFRDVMSGEEISNLASCSMCTHTSYTGTEIQLVTEVQGNAAALDADSAACCVKYRFEVQVDNRRHAGTSQDVTIQVEEGGNVGPYLFYPGGWRRGHFDTTTSPLYEKCCTTRRTTLTVSVEEADIDVGLLDIPRTDDIALDYVTITTSDGSWQFDIDDWIGDGKSEQFSRPTFRPAGNTIATLVPVPTPTTVTTRRVTTTSLIPTTLHQTMSSVTTKAPVKTMVTPTRELPVNPNQTVTTTQPTTHINDGVSNGSRDRDNATASASLTNSSIPDGAIVGTIASLLLVIGVTILVVCLRKRILTKLSAVTKKPAIIGSVSTTRGTPNNYQDITNSDYAVAYANDSYTDVPYEQVEGGYQTAVLKSVDSVPARQPQLSSPVCVTAGNHPPEADVTDNVYDTGEIYDTAGHLRDTEYADLAAASNVGIGSNTYAAVSAPPVARTDEVAGASNANDVDIYQNTPSLPQQSNDDVYADIDARKKMMMKNKSKVAGQEKNELGKEESENVYSHLQSLSEELQHSQRQHRNTADGDQHAQADLYDCLKK